MVNYSIESLKLYFDKITEVLKYTRQANLSIQEAKQIYIKSRENLQDVIIVAKLSWASVLADTIHQMSYFSRDSWKVVNTFKNWIQGRHKIPEIMRFRKK